MFKPKNCDGLDVSGIILHSKMIFMNHVIMAGFSAEVQVLLGGGWFETNYSKKYSVYSEVSARKYFNFYEQSAAGSFLQSELSFQ